MRAPASATVERGVDDVFEYLSGLTTTDDRVAGGSGTGPVVGDGGFVGDGYECEHE